MVCKYLGLGASGIAFKGATFGEGEGPVSISNVKCYGNESSLLECFSVGGERRTCDHSKDAGVRCSGRGVHLIHMWQTYKNSVVNSGI